MATHQAPPALLSPHAPALLAAHACQGESNDCGPFALSMALAALRPDRAVPPEHMVRVMARPRPRAILGLLPLVRRIPGWATFPWGVADAARQAGLRARWRVFGTTDALVAALARGEVPIAFLGGWRPRPWGHIAALVAWDGVRGWGFADSLSPEATITWRPDDAFRRRWRALGNQWVALGAPPSPATEPAR